MKAFEKQRKKHNFANRNCEVLEDNSEGKVKIRKKKKVRNSVKEVDV